MKVVDSHIKKLTEEASELNGSITRLLLDHETELGEDRVGQWKAQQANIARDMKDYSLRMYQQVDQVEGGLNIVQNQMNQLTVNSQAASNSFQAEQVALTREHIEIFRDEKASEIETKRTAAAIDIRNRCKAICNDIDDLNKELNKVPSRSWKDETDLSTRTVLKLEHIKQLLEVCLWKSYFLWNDQIHCLKDSGPIGLSLMVVLAESFLQTLESKALSIASALPTPC